MLKRGLMIVLFLVLLSSTVCAGFSSFTSTSFYEGSEQSLNLSINNFKQAQIIKEVQLSAPGIIILNASSWNWLAQFNATHVRWYNGTIETNVKDAAFEIQITAPTVSTDTNLTFTVTKVNQDNSIASETHNVTLLDDTTPPNITSLNPANGTAVFANSMRTITANVQETQSQLQNVTYTYGDCNATNTTIVLNCTGSTCTGQANFTSFDEGDTACYKIYAENNVGGNTTQTGQISFTGIPPSVFDVNPTPGNLYIVTDALYITANVTDDGTVDTVLARVQYPNGTVENLTLTKITGTNKYSRLFNTPDLIGTYNVTIIATDTKGNVNNSETTNFTIVPEYNFNINLNPATARPGRTVRISGTVKLNNGSDIPENKVAIDIQGTETNVTLTGGAFSHTFNAPQNTGTYNIQVKVYANSGYLYSSIKRLIVSNPNTDSSTGWGWDFDEFEGYETEGAGVAQAPAVVEAPVAEDEDAGVAKAPEQKDAGTVIQEEEPTPEEVIDEILSKPNQVTGSAVGLGGKASLIALLLLVAGLITLAYSNTRIRHHLHTFAKEKVGSKFAKKKKEEKPAFSDEEWEEYFRKLRGD